VQLGAVPRRARIHQQCDVNYLEIRRATLWSYEFHRRIDGRVPPAEGTGPYEKLPIPTDLAIVHITLLVDIRLIDFCITGRKGLLGDSENVLWSRVLALSARWLAQSRSEGSKEIRNRLETCVEVCGNISDAPGSCKAHSQASIHFNGVCCSWAPTFESGAVTRPGNQYPRLHARDQLLFFFITLERRVE